MEYIYAAMLLHAAKQPLNEENITKTLQSVSVNPDAAKVKALVAALEGINIDEAIKKAAAAPVAAAPAQAGEAKKEEKKDEKSSEEASAGLAALFG